MAFAPHSIRVLHSSPEMEKLKCFVRNQSSTRSCLCAAASDSDPHSDTLSRESMIYVGKERPTDIESLPKELLFEILLRLPADHLYERARLVCRWWCHIIHSHAFINAQIHGATYGLLLCPLKRYTPPLHPLYVTADADGGIHSSELNHFSKWGVLATCNGLVLDAKDYWLLRIVNPATKQSFLLPELPRRHLSYARFEYGFAYSAASSAYKVIQLCALFQSPPRLVADYGGLDVLTVGVDESWRHVEVHHLPDHVRSFFFRDPPLTSEGFLHWGWGRYSATMDVETEIITLSEAPCRYNECYYYYLSTGRCLSLLVACGDLSWEVWEMKAETGEWRMALPNVDLGAEECRIKQLAPKDGAVLEPLGWVKYPHVLAFYFGECYCSGQWWHCIFYNFDTHELDSIELPESYTTGGYYAFPHKNNLIWLS